MKNVAEAVYAFLGRMSTRRCTGCGDMSFHTAHLTVFGRRRYTGRWSV